MTDVAINQADSEADNPARDDKPANKKPTAGGDPTDPTAANASGNQAANLPDGGESDEANNSSSA